MWVWLSLLNNWKTDKGFDISSIFAKKTIEVISSDEKSKSEERKPDVPAKK